MENRTIVFFDGECILCSRIITWIAKHDKNMYFAYLQSDFAQGLLAGKSFSPNNLDTVILYDSGHLSTKSTAILNIYRKIGGIYALASVFAIVPVAIRDSMYDWVSRNRYRWFGKKKSCSLWDESMRARLIG